MSYSVLSKIDVGDKTERKGKFTYLSWAWAWAKLKEVAPDATFEKHIFGDLPYMVAPDGDAFVQVTVTVDGLALSEIMPVLNHQNKSIKNPSSFDVNTSLQRCLAKAIAMHGLGLYIYAGEDLPPGEAVEDLPKFTAMQINQFGAEMRTLIDDKNDTEVGRSLADPARSEIWQAANVGTPPQGQFTSAQKKAQGTLGETYRARIEAWAIDAITLCSEGAVDGLMELVGDIDDPIDKGIFWAKLDEATRQMIRSEKSKEKAA